MIRTFVAIELDTPLRKALAQVQADLRNRLQTAMGPDVRIQWVKPESVHLTLKFLGDIPEERVSEIVTALARVAGAHIRSTVDVGGLGAFPDARAPRVLWVGLSGQVEGVKRLAAAVERALAELGFAPEPKPFNPHLTLARIKERSRDVGRALAAGRMLERAAPLGTVMVNAIALMQSELKPSGAVYTKLCEVSLKEA
ncbi:MAG: RNA 2',3'-cyclic phosphodiesterase [Nitrospirota bacterium]